jgi:threonine aldolase
MVKFNISNLDISSDRFVSILEEKGILSLTISDKDIRIVTHRGIEREHIDKALEIISETVRKIRRI